MNITKLRHSHEVNKRTSSHNKLGCFLYHHASSTSITPCQGRYPITSRPLITGDRLWSLVEWTPCLLFTFNYVYIPYFIRSNENITCNKYNLKLLVSFVPFSWAILFIIFSLQFNLASRVGKFCMISVVWELLVVCDNYMGVDEDVLRIRFSQLADHHTPSLR